MNSPPNNSPAASPASSVPSRASSAMPRALHQSATISVAAAERIAACSSGGMSWMASLVATWLKPQDRHSTTTMVGGERVERTGVMVMG